MRLVIGGAWQGKRDWAVRQWAVDPSLVMDGADCREEALKKSAVIDHFHLLVRRWMAAGEDAVMKTEAMLRENPDIIVISDEVGCGIVPVDKGEREYREVHGRICCYLAGQADEVVRVCCGIGQYIKTSSVQEQK